MGTRSAGFEVEGNSAETPVEVAVFESAGVMK
jgi:hypothetical protein